MRKSIIQLLFLGSISERIIFCPSFNGSTVSAFAKDHELKYHYELPRNSKDCTAIYVTEPRNVYQFLVSDSNGISNEISILFDSLRGSTAVVRGPSPSNKCIINFIVDPSPGARDRSNIIITLPEDVGWKDPVATSLITFFAPGIPGEAGESYKLPRGAFILLTEERNPLTPYYQIHHPKLRITAPAILELCPVPKDEESRPTSCRNDKGLSRRSQLAKRGHFLITFHEGIALPSAASRVTLISEDPLITSHLSKQFLRFLVCSPLDMIVEGILEGFEGNSGSWDLKNGQLNIENFKIGKGSCRFFILDFDSFSAEQKQLVEPFNQKLFLLVNGKKNEGRELVSESFHIALYKGESFVTSHVMTIFGEKKYSLFTFRSYLDISSEKDQYVSIPRVPSFMNDLQAKHFTSSVHRTYMGVNIGKYNLNLGKSTLNDSTSVIFYAPFHSAESLLQNESGGGSEIVPSSSATSSVRIARASESVVTHSTGCTLKINIESTGHELSREFVGRLSASKMTLSDGFCNEKFIEPLAGMERIVFGFSEKFEAGSKTNVVGRGFTTFAVRTKYHRRLSVALMGWSKLLPSDGNISQVKFIEDSTFKSRKGAYYEFDNIGSEEDNSEDLSLLSEEYLNGYPEENNKLNKGTSTVRL